VKICLSVAGQTDGGRNMFGQKNQKSHLPAQPIFLPSIRGQTSGQTQSSWVKPVLLAGLLDKLNANTLK
jgi:hypothetical protein